MYSHFKRAFDIVISVLALVVLSPIMLVTAILVRLDSPGEIIFKQERVGRDGKTFLMYKFRSMCVGAEHMGSGQYSYKGDSRVTKVGYVIRKLSIDELPQLVNIIKGDMSLIGPRPVLTYHPKKYSEYTPEQLKRFSVRPGITGLAQVNGRKAIGWDERIAFDIYYTEHLSLTLDTKIFFKTILKILCASDNENQKTDKRNGTDENVKPDVHNQ